MLPDEFVLIAALILLAGCAALVGFNFWAALGFSLALGLIFYLIQSGAGAKKNRDQEN